MYNLINIIDVHEDGENLDVVFQRDPEFRLIRDIRFPGFVVVVFRMFNFVLFLDPLQH